MLAAPVILSEGGWAGVSEGSQNAEIGAEDTAPEARLILAQDDSRGFEVRAF